MWCNTAPKYYKCKNISNNMIESLLEELGLSKYEIKIYLTLINLRESTAGKTAETAKINRRNVYDALNRLIKKGFISYQIKNNKKYYTATNPKKILDLYQEKTEIIKDLLPEILSQYKESPLQREIQVYENFGGIKTIFTKFFDKKDPIYIIGATGLALEKMPIFFTNKFKKLKNKEIKQLWNYDAKNIQKYKQQMNSQDKILPNRFKTSTQLFISDNTTIILIWSSIPLAIEIIDQEITKGFKEYFNFLWKISKSI